MTAQLELRHLEPSDEEAFRAACRELDADDFEFGIGWHEGDTFAEYLARLAREQAGIELPADRVPATFLVAVAGGELVGRVSIRHRLNDRLTAVGGHIGYGVRPAHRGRGYGTEILRRALEVARELGIESVLLTTDASNRASQRVIESNGGVREPADSDVLGIRRYWIELNRPVEYDRSEVPSTEELVALYGSVGWTAYTDDPEALSRAVAASTFVVTARENGGLVGLARVMSDDVAIFYLQDLLVAPEYQRRGIGSRLLEMCMDRFSHVRQKVLVTDDEPHQHRLYRSFGFRDLDTIDWPPVHAFVQFGNDSA